MVRLFQRNRARQKIDWISEVFPRIKKSHSILDLGCAEGFLGELLQKEFGASVSLVDVVDMNKTDLALTIYDGSELSYKDNYFDVCLLVFVLHHTSDAKKVLEEAARVSKKVVVLESVYQSQWDLKQLTFLDKLFNRVRSGGKMNDQEEHLYFRRITDWQMLFSELNFKLLGQSEKGRIFHQQAMFVLNTE